MDKKSIIIGIFAGVMLGIIISVSVTSILITAFGESVRVGNVNITITVPLNQSRLEEFIKESQQYQPKKNNSAEIENFLYNGVYGWVCQDTRSYEPARSNLTQSHLDRGCKLISIEGSSANRTYSVNRTHNIQNLDNGWT